MWQSKFYVQGQKVIAQLHLNCKRCIHFTFIAWFLLMKCTRSMRMDAMNIKFEILDLCHSSQILHAHRDCLLTFQSVFVGVVVGGSAFVSVFHYLWVGVPSRVYLWVGVPLCVCVCVRVCVCVCVCVPLCVCMCVIWSWVVHSWFFVVIIVENMTIIDMSHAEPDFHDFIDEWQMTHAKVEKDTLQSTPQNSKTCVKWWVLYWKVFDTPCECNALVQEMSSLFPSFNLFKGTSLLKKIFVQCVQMWVSAKY